jgi:hypothetical protein
MMRVDGTHLNEGAMTITRTISAETEQRLRELAAEAGQTVEGVVGRANRERSSVR